MTLTLEREPTATEPRSAHHDDVAPNPPISTRPPIPAMSAPVPRRWRRWLGVLVALTLCVAVALGATSVSGGGGATSPGTTVGLEPVDADGTTKPDATGLGPSEGDGGEASPFTGTPATKECSERPQWLPLPCLKAKP